MFKNFDKVFKFSFRNQALTAGYKRLTIIFSLILFAAPVVIMLIVAYNMNNKTELKDCGAKNVYVVNDTPGNDSFFEDIKDIPEKDYSGLSYIICNDLDEALNRSSKDKESIVLLLGSESGLTADIIIPTGSEISKSKAKNYLKFIDRYEDVFAAGLSGLSDEEIAELSLQVSYKTYTASGYEKNMSIEEDTEKSDELMRDQVYKAFSLAIPYATIMLLYFMIVTYGQTLAQSIVMEKESKLMDTMLVSVKPESLVFGKLLSAVLSMLVQVGAWLVSVILGFTIGNFLVGSFFPATKFSLTVFFAGMKDINVFRPLNVALAVIYLILGIVLYLCMAAIAGSMSTTKEDVSSKSSIFIFPLIISFMVIIGAGGLSADTVSDWMLIIPFTAAMLMPADVSLGAVSAPVMAGSFVCFIIVVVILVYAAGRIYKMMSLYKGNKLPIADVLKRSFSKS